MAIKAGPLLFCIDFTYVYCVPIFSSLLISVDSWQENANFTIWLYHDTLKNLIKFVFSCYESKKITMKKIGLAMIFWKTVKYDSMYLVACNINANEKIHFLNN